jgi:hypothetical protein
MSWFNLTSYIMSYVFLLCFSPQTQSIVPDFYCYPNNRDSGDDEQLVVLATVQ